MYRIDSATAISPLPAPSAPGPNPNCYYTDGNPGLSIPATIVPPEHLNMMQEEICNVILAAGIALSKADRTQLLQAIRGGGGTYLPDTGAANAYVVTPATPFVAYFGGMTISFVPANVNTAAATINVSGLGVKSIVLQNGDALRAGDIPANGLTTIKYQATLGKFILAAPSTPAYVTAGNAGYFRIPGTPFIVQWLQVSTPAGAGSGVSVPTGINWYNLGTLAWPITFPSACLGWSFGPEYPNDTYMQTLEGLKSATGLNTAYYSKNSNAIAMLSSNFHIVAIGL